MSVDPEKDPQTRASIGAAMAVHRQLGFGFLELVYQQALAIELSRAEVPHEREAQIPVYYDGVRLEAAYRADFICYSEVLVELKALDRLTGTERAQVLKYLRASRLKLALLLNFGTQSLQFERLVNNFDDP